MAAAPKNVLNEITKITTAWKNLADTAKFAGLTLEEFKTKVKPSLDARELIDKLNNQLTAAIDQRDNADAVSAATCQKVVKGVVGDPEYGDDSDLYDAFGYVRKSERKSGLKRTRKTSTTFHKKEYENTAIKARPPHWILRCAGDNSTQVNIVIITVNTF